LSIAASQKIENRQFGAHRTLIVLWSAPSRRCMHTRALESCSFILAQMRAVLCAFSVLWLKHMMLSHIYRHTHTIKHIRPVSTALHIHINTPKQSI